MAGRPTTIRTAWKAKDGAIVGDGERSHLFWMAEQCENCAFKAKVRLNHGGNSGMYFRAEFVPGWPKGYEAQVDNTHSDPKRTGSLYNFANVTGATGPRRHLVGPGDHRRRQPHHHQGERKIDRGLRR